MTDNQLKPFESETFINMGKLKITEHNENWADLAIAIIKGFTDEYRYLWTSLIRANTLSDATDLKRRIKRAEELMESEYFNNLMIFSSASLTDICAQVKKDVQKELLRRR